MVTKQPKMCGCDENKPEADANLYPCPCGNHCKDHDCIVEIARRRAVSKVIYTLRNPLMLMSVPDRTEALELAKKHNITAEDLLLWACNRARNA